MTQQEFEQLAEVKITYKYFWETINPAYMESDKEKAEFCTEWKNELVRKLERRRYKEELKRWFNIDI